MIIPGIFEQDIEEIKIKIAAIEKLAKKVQIDVADGNLVNGKTLLDLNLLNSIETTVDIEIHLMTKNPADYVIPLTLVSSFCAQVEAIENISNFLETTEKLGSKKGLSLSPETPLKLLEEFAEKLDFVQLMAVLPGGQGRNFEVSTINKIELLREKYPHLVIQIDGGINEQNLTTVLNAGANNVVIGSAIFSEKNPIQKLKELQTLEESLNL